MLRGTRSLQLWRGAGSGETSAVLGAAAIEVGCCFKHGLMIMHIHHIHSLLILLTSTSQTKTNPPTLEWRVWLRRLTSQLKNPFAVHHGYLGSDTINSQSTLSVSGLNVREPGHYVADTPLLNMPKGKSLLLRAALYMS